MPAAVDDALRDRGIEVRRVAGADRSDTSARIAREVGGDHAYVAAAWPDALPAAALAAAAGEPVVLTEPGRLSPVARAALVEGGVRAATVVGGPAVVPDAVLHDLARAGVTATRLAGADRFHTARALADRSPESARRVVWLTTGRDWADSLVAAPAAAVSGGVVLLVSADILPPDHPAAVWLAARGRDIPAVRVVGGTGAVSSAVEATVGSLVAP